MTFTSGTKLGPYEVVGLLGAGGMGEVYRARDTRLGRTVAVKILSSSLTANSELKARFEREARAISQLQHPHICTLHDIGHQDGTDFLVMEYLDGETLAERLRRGSFSEQELLKIAIQITDALDRAHRAGIVHRDLKPGNIMLTKEGAKLLDFGLAKLLNAAVSAANSSSSPPSFTAAPTLTGPSPLSPLTTQGTVLGTIQYMSPEQIEGKEADPRSDIFSFGAVLYEMATGERAFQGKSQIKVASAILEDDPQLISALRTKVSPPLDHIIMTCLAKDPDERFQSALDLKIELRWAAVWQSTTTTQAQLGVRARMAWLAMSIALVLALVAAAYFAYVALQPKPVYRSTLLSPENTSFRTTNSTTAGVPALSPDGTKLAFVAADRKGVQAIYVRPLGALTAQPLAGAEDGEFPFWAPDSHNLGFFSKGKLKRIDVNGGPAQELADATLPRGGAWSKDGVIVFSPTPASVLKQIRASGGGAVTSATKFTSDEATHSWPSFLPDGEHFLFQCGPRAAVCLGQLGSSQHKIVLQDANFALYSAGQLLFVRDEVLLAQPFSLSNMQALGEAKPLAEHVATNAVVGGLGIFSVSDTGVLVYEQSQSAAGWPLTWYGRDGKPQGNLGSNGTYYGPVISPDGTRVAVADGKTPTRADIWIFDLKRGTQMRLTFDNNNGFPAWSADGKTLYFNAYRGGRESIFAKPADNSSPEQLVASPNVSAIRWKSVSLDGHQMAFMALGERSGWDIWGLSLQGDSKAFPVLHDQFTKVEPDLSPDGKWLAYASNDTGHFEVYITAFPKAGPRWQVSTDGGQRPFWRGDGKELYFNANDQAIIAMDVMASANSVVLGQPHLLFRAAMQSGPLGSYHVSRDGKKFLVNGVGTEQGGALTLVTNWPAELKK
jgi:eukaryotic-like serine/threonine-protein kinase